MGADRGQNLIAMNSVVRNRRLRTSAWATSRATATDVSCLKEPRSRSSAPALGARTAARSSASGVKLPAGTGVFGIVRWKVKKDKPAFSADTADWNKGRFLTDLDTPGKGVLDAEVSPDGKRLALVSNQGSSAFRLWIADDPEDFAMSSAKQTTVRACKVTWRGDSEEVMVVQGDAECEEDIAVLARVPINKVAPARS